MELQDQTEKRVVNVHVIYTRLLRIAHGHNKDHRQDLKQLLWTLTVSADHSVPVHYKALDGNTADTDTHMLMWDSLRRIAGTSDFIYVADSKLCTRENMNHIESYIRQWWQIHHHHACDKIGKRMVS